MTLDELFVELQEKNPFELLLTFVKESRQKFAQLLENLEELVKKLLLMMDDNGSVLEYYEKMAQMKEELGRGKSAENEKNIHDAQFIHLLKLQRAEKEGQENGIVHSCGSD